MTQGSQYDPVLAQARILRNCMDFTRQSGLACYMSDHVKSDWPCTLQMIVYGTISGGLGVLLPFTNAVDLDLFSQLEMHMRQLAPSLVGRDHLAFRSSFFPVRDVVDGDLCEQYPSLTAEKQQQISQETDRSPGELLKKLEDMRNKVL